MCALHRWLETPAFCNCSLSKFPHIHFYLVKNCNGNAASVKSSCARLETVKSNLKVQPVWRDPFVKKEVAHTHTSESSVPEVTFHRCNDNLSLNIYVAAFHNKTFRLQYIQFNSHLKEQNMCTLITHCYVFSSRCQLKLLFSSKKKKSLGRWWCAKLYARSELALNGEMQPTLHHNCWM